MNHGSLFSGIGGFDLAAEWMGWNNVFHCEWNPFGRKVLNHYWPNSISYEDITKTDFSIHTGNIDILTGGFPCQPYSMAGKRLGKDDERHLWPEMLRAIREISPRWVVGENVFGLVNWNGGMVFDEVQADLEAQGYEVQPFVLPACAVNAPHRRDRIFFVAYTESESSERMRPEQRKSSESEQGEFGGINSENVGYRNTSDTNHRGRLQAKIQTRGQLTSMQTWANFPTQSPICSRNDGLPSQLDGITFPKWRNESIKAYGNAIVPQVVYQIFKAISIFEQNATKP
jgi:DNA (cytosine-5)-methyltransferase 1